MSQPATFARTVATGGHIQKLTETQLHVANNSMIRLASLILNNIDSCGRSLRPKELFVAIPV
jgi:hypothetical protein